MTVLTGETEQEVYHYDAMNMMLQPAQMLFVMELLRQNMIVFIENSSAIEAILEEQGLELRLMS